MIFRPELVEKILSGRKSVTRRVVDYDKPQRYVEKGVYAVQPGRGKAHVSHIEVLDVSIEQLHQINGFDADREGFRSVAEFEAYWEVLHGEYNPKQEVYRIGFKLADFCEKCGEGAKDMGKKRTKKAEGSA